jgi:hypothetical protein
MTQVLDDLMNQAFEACQKRESRRAYPRYIAQLELVIRGMAQGKPLDVEQMLRDFILRETAL